MRYRLNTFDFVLISLIFVSFLLIFLEGSLILHGKIVEGDLPSNVTISKSLAIDMSSGLEGGIIFGDVLFLPATNINATHNYDGTSDSSTFYINVSTDSNTNVDFCIKGSGDLESAALDAIGLGNETYFYSNESNITSPLVEEEVSFTTSYVKAGEGVIVGDKIYYRFWLDVPGAQPSGDYNNTVSFKGVSTGTSC